MYHHPVECLMTHVFFLNSALLAVVGIGHSWPTTYCTATLVGSIIAFITYTHECAWTNIGVTNNTLSITCRREREIEKKKAKKEKIEE